MSRRSAALGVGKRAFLALVMSGRGAVALPREQRGSVSVSAMSRVALARGEAVAELMAAAAPCCVCFTGYKWAFRVRSQVKKDLIADVFHWGSRLCLHTCCH